MRRQLNKVFPDHWSFMLGEVALYSFIILLLTGTYLTFFFDPSMSEVPYHGGYTPLRGVTMSHAYESTLRISFDVRGGLIVRQMHHWAALMFVAAIVAHVLRIFFTGAFRKPRETNWLIGTMLMWLGIQNPVIRLGFGLFGRRMQQRFYLTIQSRMRVLLERAAAGLPLTTPQREVGSLLVAPSDAEPHRWERIARRIHHPGS